MYLFCFVTAIVTVFALKTVNVSLVICMYHYHESWLTIHLKFQNRNSNCDAPRFDSMVMRQPVQ